MAPQAADKMKQKSLVSFFGKKDGAANATSSDKSKPKLVPAATPKRPSGRVQGKENPPVSSPASEFRTPLPKASSQSTGVGSATYTRSSDGGHSTFETPPTSDPIDVDMISSDIDTSEMAQSSVGKSVCPHVSTSIYLQLPNQLRCSAQSANAKPS